MQRKRSAFGSIYRRRAGDGKVVPQNYRGPCRPGYYVRIRVGGRDCWRQAGETIEQATAFLSKAQLDLHEFEVHGTRPIEERLFEDAANEYLHAVERTHSPTTHHDESNKTKYLLIPRFKGRPLSSIKSSDIERFIEERAADVSIATRNRDLSLLSSIFRRAMKLGYCRENPARGFSRPKEAVRSFPYVDVAAQRKLVDSCHESIRPLVTLALETGLRQGELLRLEWPDIDMDRRELTVRVSKTKRPRTVPLTGAAHAALAGLQATRGAIPMEGVDRVFSAIPDRWAGHTRRLYVAATKAARCSSVRFHDLRHLFATNLVRAGVPITDVSKLLGHATLAMSLRYASHAPADFGTRAVAALEGFKVAEQAKAEAKAKKTDSGSAAAASA
jgi:integrase